MPDDPTPHGGEALHPPPERAQIPTPRERPAAGDVEDQARIRPPLPQEDLPPGATEDGKDQEQA